MREEIKKIYCSTRKDWRQWLKTHHSIEKVIWLVYYKKHTNKPTVNYNEAVEEALCYGWIDSTVRRIDDEKYCQQFTPRNVKSVWSDLNKERVEKLIKSKKMTKYGLAKVNKAKENGMWYKEYIANKDNPMSKELREELNRNRRFKTKFDKLSPAHKKRFINWVLSAKKEETRINRSKKVVEMLLENKALGMS